MATQASNVSFDTPWDMPTRNASASFGKRIALPLRGYVARPVSVPGSRFSTLARESATSPCC